MKNTILLFSLIFLLYMSSPAGAVEEVTQQHITTFDIPSPSDRTISQIHLNNLAPTSTTNLTLSSYGATYLLNVTSDKSWGWWTFDFELTSPDGSKKTAHCSKLAPLSSAWFLHLQDFGLNGASTSDIDVFVNLPNLSASFFPPLTQSEYENVLPFSNVQGQSSVPFDLTLSISTDKEFEEQQNGSITAQISGAVSDVFSWTWTNLLTFVEKIPLVGGHLSAILVLTTMTLSSILFYTKLLFIDYSETTFLTIEFFILSYAFTKGGNFWTKIKRVVDSHVKLIELTLNTAQAAVNLFSSIVRIVADVVQSLKPI